MNKNKGFTLIEIIVALGIFAIVATVALAALVKIISANRKAQTLQAAITNLNFSLESMTREMRTGSIYSCTDNLNNLDGENISPEACNNIKSFSDSAGDYIAFKSSKTANKNTNTTCPLAIAYRLNKVTSPDGFVLEKAEQEDCNDKIKDDDFAPITSTSNLVITNYKLLVNDTSYQRATIWIRGYAGVREKDKTYFDIQTSVSARIQQ